MTRLGRMGLHLLAPVALGAMLAATASAQTALTWPGGTAPLGKSDPAFSQPSLPSGIDYTLPTEAEVKAALDRVRTTSSARRATR